MTPSLQNLRIQPLLGAQPLGAHASPRKPWSCAPLALLALSLTLGMPSASLEAKKSESINEPNVWSRLGVWGVISGPWNQSEILQETIQNKESPSETPKTMQDLQANQMKGLINRLVDPSTHSNSIKNLQVLVDAGVSDYDAIQLLLQWTMPNEKLIEAMIKTKPGANLIADATPKIMAPANKTSDDLANIIRKNLDPFFTNQNAKNFAWTAFPKLPSDQKSKIMKQQNGQVHKKLLDLLQSSPPLPQSPPTSLLTQRSSASHTSSHYLEPVTRQPISSFNSHIYEEIDGSKNTGDSVGSISPPKKEN